MSERIVIGKDKHGRDVFKGDTVITSDQFTTTVIGKQERGDLMLLDFKNCTPKQKPVSAWHAPSSYITLVTPDAPKVEVVKFYETSKACGSGCVYVNFKGALNYASVKQDWIQSYSFTRMDYSFTELNRNQAVQRIGEARVQDAERLYGSVPAVVPNAPKAPASPQCAAAPVSALDPDAYAMEQSRLYWRRMHDTANEDGTPRLKPTQRDLKREAAINLMLAETNLNDPHMRESCVAKMITLTRDGK